MPSFDDSLPSETPQLLQQNVGLDRRAPRSVPSFDQLQKSASSSAPRPAPALGSEPPELANTYISQRSKVTTDPARPGVTTNPNVPAEFAKTTPATDNPVLARLQAAERAAAEQQLAERREAEKQANDRLMAARRAAAAAPRPVVPPLPATVSIRAAPAPLPATVKIAPQAPAPLPPTVRMAPLAPAPAARVAAPPPVASPRPLTAQPQAPARAAAPPPRAPLTPLAPPPATLRQQLASRINAAEVTTDPLGAPNIAAALAKGPKTVNQRALSPEQAQRTNIVDLSGDALQPPDISDRTNIVELSGDEQQPPEYADRTNIVALPPDEEAAADVTNIGAIPVAPGPVITAPPSAAAMEPEEFAHTNVVPYAPVKTDPVAAPVAAPPPRAAVQLTRAPLTGPPGVPMPASAQRTQIAQVPSGPDDDSGASPNEIRAAMNAVRLTEQPAIAVTRSEVIRPPAGLMPTPLNEEVDLGHDATRPRATMPPSAFQNLPSSMQKPVTLGPDFLVTQPGSAGPYSKATHLAAHATREERAVEPPLDEQLPDEPGEGAALDEAAASAARLDPVESDQVLASPASSWRRTIAWLLDLAVLGGLSLGALFVAATVAGKKPPPISLAALEAFLFHAGGVLLPAAAAGVLLVVLYTTVFGALLKGRTPGRLLLGIRLVDSTGQAPGFFRALLRALFSLLSFALFLSGFWLALFDRRGQTLHDKLTRTFVVRPV